MDFRPSVLCICFFLLVIVACKNNQSKPLTATPTKDTAVKKFTIATNGVMPDTPVTSAFDDPIAVANNKYSHFDQILKKDLCNKLWQFDGGMNGSNNITTEDLKGQWMEFKENNTYTKGLYSKITETGGYTVDNLGMMELTPKGKSTQKHEYQLKFNNDVLIFIGTPKYSDSHMQLRLSRIFAKPKK